MGMHVDSRNVVEGLGFLAHIGKLAKHAAQACLRYLCTKTLFIIASPICPCACCISFCFCLLHAHVWNKQIHADHT